jgi:hypothetical protein
MLRDSEKSRLISQLVQLIISTTNFEATWTRFLLMLQAGLAAALWVVVAYAAEHVTPQRPITSQPVESGQRSFFVFVSTLLPLFGIITCTAITLILIRISRWNAWYIQKTRELSGAYLFPRPREDHAAATDLEHFPIGRRASTVRAMSVLIVIGWTCVAMLRLWSEGYEATSFGEMAIGVIAVIVLWRSPRCKPVPSGKGGDEAKGSDPASGSGVLSGAGSAGRAATDLP